MAATFVVEDGTGLSTSNSYSSVEYADQYFENYGNPSTWSSATPESKQEALRIGARYLDLKYGERAQGIQKNSDQAMVYGRYGVYDWRNEIFLDDTILPVNLVKANCEAALLHMTETDGLLPDIESYGPIKGETIKIGPITESIQYQGSRSQYKKFSTIDQLMKPLLVQSNMVERS